MNHELIVLKTKLSRGIKVNRSRLKALQAGVDGEEKFHEFISVNYPDYIPQHHEDIFTLSDYTSLIYYTSPSRINNINKI